MLIARRLLLPTLSLFLFSVTAQGQGSGTTFPGGMPGGSAPELQVALTRSLIPSKVSFSRSIAVLEPFSWSMTSRSKR